MKKDIKKLELAKLFKEFGFLKTDEEYKTELQSSYGPEFSKAIENIFQNNPDLNLLFNVSAAVPEIKKKTLGLEMYNPNYNNEKDIEIFTGSNYDKTTIKREPIINEDIKKLYWKIATKTHPDKVNNTFLNTLYLKSQLAYETNDIFTIYQICNDLDIDYEFPEAILLEFKHKIKALHANNSHVEQTYLWAWIHEEDENIKLNILHHFITHAYVRT